MSYLLFYKTPAIASLLFSAALSVSAADNLNAAQMSCLLEPNSQVEISSQVTGIVKEVAVKRGDSVEKGDLLLALEDEVAQNTLDIARARYAYAKQQVQRNDNIADKGFISEAQHQELLTNKKLAWLSVKEAKVILKQQSIRSPIQGVIVKRHVSAGEYISVDPLFEVVSLDPLHAEVVFRASEYGQIKTGMTVQLTLDGYPEQHQGEVTIVDPVIDAASGTFGVRVELPNPDKKIPSGLNCRINFNNAQ